MLSLTWIQIVKNDLKHRDSAGLWREIIIYRLLWYDAPVIFMFRLVW